MRDMLRTNKVSAFRTDELSGLQGAPILIAGAELSGQGESVAGEAEDVIRGGSFGLDGATADAGGGGTAAGVCPRTFHRWAVRYEEHGIEGLRDKRLSRASRPTTRRWIFNAMLSRRKAANGSSRTRQAVQVIALVSETPWTTFELEIPSLCGDSTALAAP